MAFKPTICIDFDGVLHSYVSGWQGPDPSDPPTDGAQEFVKELLSRGFYIVIQSTRAATDEGLRYMVAWLALHSFPMQHPDGEPIKITDQKPMALLYIDDRGLRFSGDFQEILDWMNDFPKMQSWTQLQKAE